MRAAADDMTASHLTPDGTGAATGSLAAPAHALFAEQQREWPLLRENVAALAGVRTRWIDLGEFAMKVQFNPGRIASSGAKIDAKSIRERKCFLCAANRPAEQRGLPFNHHYSVLANPFPIFPEHFTIPHATHRPQHIAAAAGDLLDLARVMSPRYTVFYNGPKCGASAPDHLHFQAGDRGWMPIEAEYDRLKGEPLAGDARARLYAANSIRPFVAIESDDRAAAVAAFTAVCAELATIAPAEEEPMMNVLAWYAPAASNAAAAGDLADGGAAGEWRIVVLPRAKHRPAFYYADGEARLLLSPGSVDLGGVCVLPLERDFDRLTADHLRTMFDEVMLSPDRFHRLRARLATSAM